MSGGGVQPMLGTCTNLQPTFSWKEVKASWGYNGHHYTTTTHTHTHRGGEGGREGGREEHTYTQTHKPCFFSLYIISLTNDCVYVQLCDYLQPPAHPLSCCPVPLVGGRALLATRQWSHLDWGGQLLTRLLSHISLV